MKFWGEWLSKNEAAYKKKAGHEFDTSFEKNEKTSIRMFFDFHRKRNKHPIK